MKDLCYNNKNKKAETAKSRMETIFELLKLRGATIESMERGKIEIHFSGKEVSASLQDFWK